MNSPCDSPCEIVHEFGDAEEIAAMLYNRHCHGWVLDRIIQHHVPPIGRPGMASKPRVVIYYFIKK